MYLYFNNFAEMLHGGVSSAVVPQFWCKISMLEGVEDKINQWQRTKYEV